MITFDPDRRALLAIRCPHCRAAAGQRCTVPSSGKPLANGVFHQSRRDAMATTGRGAA